HNISYRMSNQPKLEALTWETLEKWTYDKLQKMLGFPPDEIVTFIFATDSNSDIEAYLIELFGDSKKTKTFIEQLTKKINSLPRRIRNKVAKPSTNQRNNMKQAQGQQQQVQKKVGGTKTKMHINAFSELSIDTGKPGDPCECQATRHKLITNCLNCGKVICEQEGKGPCKFCGTALFSKPHPTTNAQLQSQKDRELASAVQYKDTILGYQKNSVQRTIVFDDQEDYFSNATNKWLSSEERATIADQEREHLQRVEEKKKSRFTIDIMGGKILPAAAKPVDIRGKLDLKPSSTSVTSNSTNQLEDLISTDKPSVNYVNDHLKGKVVRKDTNNDNNNNNQKNQKNKHTSIVQQYYGVEEDLLVLQNKEIIANRLTFKGIMEGLWYRFGKAEQRRTPRLEVYKSYMDAMKNKNSNYFIVAPDNYSSEASLDTPLPTQTIQFLKQLVEYARSRSVTINVAITLPKEFVFAAPGAVTAMRSRLDSYHAVGVSEFSVILPSCFNEALNAQVCAPNSATAETNTAKAYSAAQVSFINGLFDNGGAAKFKEMFVCPSFFEIDLKVAPTRQQIEYWREISKGLNNRCHILFSTPSGRLDDQLLNKIHNIFDKRKLIAIEKFPYGTRNHQLYLDPYHCQFSPEASSAKLTGVVASPFDCQPYLDQMTSLIPLTTFIQYLQSPSTYSEELTLRANLLEMLGNESLAEAFSDVIMALSNGVLQQLKQQQLDGQFTALDARGRVFMSTLIDKSKMLLEHFGPNSAEIQTQLQDIINVLSNLI
ncbi:hypothetical protein SAMD00019534_079680, partial [Acytostelium subglobosum LB1]|uniref:hypothetical protein n=1 Tax=Acytostelium subglobosum LB1 TaxID=1410327 RepID=UPI000644C33C